MKIIDDKIRKAIITLKAHLKTNKAVAETLGLSAVQVGYIMKEKTQYFNNPTWERIEPILAPYMASGGQAVAITNSTIIGDNNHISGDALGAVIRKIMASERLSDAEKLKFIDIING